MRAQGGRGKHIRLRASDISARASTPLDERRRYLSIQKFSSESDTTYSRYENEKGCCARADSEGTLNEVTKLYIKIKSIKH